MWLLSFVLASYSAEKKLRFKVVSDAVAAFMAVLSLAVEVEAMAVASAMQSFS